jgi:hypothetical protein
MVAGLVNSQIQGQLQTAHTETMNRLDAMQNKTDSRFDALERRVHAIEQAASASSSTAARPPGAASSSYSVGPPPQQPPPFPPPVQDVDPLQQNDAWANYRRGMPGPPHFPPPQVVRGEVRPPARFNISAQRSPNSSVGGQEGEGRFVCKKLFVRGWCEYDDDDSKGELGGILKTVGEGLVRRLEQHMQHWLEVPERRFWAPRHRNKQLTINIHERAPHDAGFQMMSAINRSPREHPVKVLGKEVYITRDMELWQKKRNGFLVRSKKLITPFLDGETAVIQDWSGGQLWLRRGGVERIVGTWTAADGFTWIPDAISAFCPEADLAALAEKMHSR